MVLPASYPYNGCSHNSNKVFLLKQAWIYNEVNISKINEVFIICLGQQEDAISGAGCQSRPWPKKKMTSMQDSMSDTNQEQLPITNVSWSYMEALFTWWKKYELGILINTFQVWNKWQAFCRQHLQTCFLVNHHSMDGKYSAVVNYLFWMHKYCIMEEFLHCMPFTKLWPFQTDIVRIFSETNVNNIVLLK